MISSQIEDTKLTGILKPISNKLYLRDDNVINNNMETISKTKWKLEDPLPKIILVT